MGENAADFNPRVPCGTRHAGRKHPEHVLLISTHASLAGRDYGCSRSSRAASRFQPTRPLRDATPPVYAACLHFVGFQPTRPLRDATKISQIIKKLEQISTHASLAGRDGCVGCRFIQLQHISTHASLAGRDCDSRERAEYLKISTHASLAGRDASSSPRRAGSRDFNPRVPCGTRQSEWCIQGWSYLFQPTRPLRDATGSASRTGCRNMDFNPRVPCGTRRGCCREGARANAISTHASLAGRDSSGSLPHSFTRYFNPRVPCGTRRATCDIIKPSKGFQPTRPLRDATTSGRRPTRSPTYFNPRVPCGTRREPMLVWV